MVIGAIGSALIAASSLYIALKLGALPWPIGFAGIYAYLRDVLGAIPSMLFGNVAIPGVPSASTVRL